MSIWTASARGVPLSFGVIVLAATGALACDADAVHILGRVPLPGDGAPIGTGGGEARDGTAGPPRAGGDAGGCEPPAPLRDYDFTGFGTELGDRTGAVSGEILGGAELDGSGELGLDGDDDYVNLPNGILSGLNEVTVVVWVRHRGGPAYTRIFDFGIGSDGEDPAEGQGTVGRSYLAATPGTGFVPRYLAALISDEGAGGQIAAVTESRLDDALHSVAVVVSTERLGLFFDGVLTSRVPSSVSPLDIEDVNNWLGRSQYDQDPYLNAAYAGLRVYGEALAECAIRVVHAAGPFG